jgi:leader peptidase (prepilin peptidase)/N-methyltransferase
MDGYLIAAFLFVCGLFFGSFLNVVADRLWNGEPIVRGRSHCEHCNKPLAWYELIPVLSFLLQQGKCSKCKAKLSWWYPFSELLTGVAFACVGLTIPLLMPFNLLLLLCLVACLLVIFFADWKYGIIPFPVVIAGLLVAIAFLLLVSPGLLLWHLVAGLGSGGFFLLIFLITKGRGMGFGDVIYAFFMGVLLGFPGVFLGLYLAFLTGAIVSLILVLLHKKKLHGDTIPFGPFLVLGTFVVLLWGEPLLQLVSWYI